MAYYPAPTGGGGGGGLAQAISLWSQFFGQGAEDRKLKNAHDKAAEERAQAEELRAQGRDDRSKLSDDLALQQGNQVLQKGKAEADLSNATQAAGTLPDLQFPDFSGVPFMPPGTTDRLNAAYAGTADQMQRTGFEGLTKRGQDLALSEPRKHLPTAGPSLVAPKWNINAGLSTGTEGALPVGFQTAADGGVSTTSKPAEMIRAEQAAKVQEGEDRAVTHPQTGAPLGVLVGGKHWVPEPAAGGPALSETQAGAFQFGSRQHFNNQLYEHLRTQPDADKQEGIWNAVVSKLAPSAMIGNSLQGQGAAKANWIAATLRRESGAAISAKEYADASAQYFPSAGDKPDVVRQKSILRKLAEQNMLGTVPPQHAQSAVANADSAFKEYLGPQTPGGTTGPVAGGADKPFPVKSPEDMKAAIAAGAKSVTYQVDGKWITEPLNSKPKTAEGRLHVRPVPSPEAAPVAQPLSLGPIPPEVTPPQYPPRAGLGSQMLDFSTPSGMTPAQAESFHALFQQLQQSMPPEQARAAALSQVMGALPTLNPLGVLPPPR